MLDGYMSNYFPLSEQFITQAEPAYCGPASLAMVLNSLNVDPMKRWKGIWRWYNEDLLHCASRDRMEQGLTLDEMTQLARCNGLHTQTFRSTEKHALSAEQIMRGKKLDLINYPDYHDHSSSCAVHTPSRALDSMNKQYLYANGFNLALFKTAIQASCIVPNLYTIINFGRKELDQTGTGHFSCIAGYNRQRDKVLVMDTARFKYPPFWVDLHKLYESVCSIDKDSQKPRGFITLSSKVMNENQDVVPDNLSTRMENCVPNTIKFMTDVNDLQLKAILK